jgi:hypothetical protein
MKKVILFFILTAISCAPDSDQVAPCVEEVEFTELIVNDPKPNR